MATAPRTQREDGRRPETEKWLNDNGVDWEFTPELRIERIDKEKSLHNQARIFEPLDIEVVRNYAEGVKRGDPFPAIVVNRPSSRARMVVVDGNHRLNAYDEAGKDHIPSYVITKAKPQTIVRMSMEANVRHGKPTTFEERVHQAIWLMDNGMGKNEASAVVSIKPSDLDKAWQRIQADRRADDVGILRTDWDRITQSSRNRLAAILTFENGHLGLTEIAKMLAQRAFEVFEPIGWLQREAGRAPEFHSPPARVDTHSVTTIQRRSSPPR